MPCRLLRALPLLLALYISGDAKAQGGRQGQGFHVRGTIVDSVSGAPLAFVNLLAVRSNDTTRWTGGSTDVEGRFRIGTMRPGSYRLKASFVGYAPLDLHFTLVGAELDMGTLRMHSTATRLDEFEVETMQTRAEQLGDTTQYNAGAFKTAPDATAEDLVRKLPGVTQDSEGLKAQGEQVRRVLVDGREFFGEDPNTALRNLPAEIIDKIQVFERQSDQAQFTGFDDGSGSMTINIVTKAGMRHGTFGRVYAGHDVTDQYSAGGSVNLMSGDRRISIIGMTNNINQQNFSDQDLLGVSQQAGGGRGDRGGGRGGRTGAPPGQSGNAGNFLVGPQGGIATTHAIGLNYGDKWGERTEVTGSYFFNFSERDQRTDLVRQQFLPGDSSLFYDEAQRNDTRNINHRINLRVEHKLDSMDSFVFTPRLSLQENRSASLTNGTNAFPSGVVDSRTGNANTSDRLGYTFNTGLLWRHRFAKARRSFSAQVDVEANDREGDISLYSLSLFDMLTDTVLLDRRTDELTSGHRVGGRFTYTEPVWEKGMLQLNYAPSYTSGITDRMVSALDPDAGTFTLLDTLLSNRFASTYLTQRGGASLRMNHEKVMWNVGLDGQYAVLTGDREFPTVFSGSRTFRNVLPNAMFMWRPTRGTSMRLFYRTSTREPSIDQLQDVVDISDPLFLRTGNADLGQSYSHNVFLRYGRTVADKGTSLFVVLGGGITDGYIGTSSTIATTSSVVVDGFVIPSGGQLRRPVNLDGAWNTRAFLTYGFPVKLLKSNLNINANYNFNRLPALINGQVNMADNHAVGQGVMLSSNISERMDFAVGYNANWNFVRNSLQTGADNDFVSSTGTARLQWSSAQHFVVRTNVAYTRYDGIADEFAVDYLLWNGSVGYKVLKDRSLELSLNLFDILGQNNSIARNITETWIEDSRTNVLGQYVMLMATWNLRYFRKAPPSGEGAPGGGRGRE